MNITKIDFINNLRVLLVRTNITEETFLGLMLYSNRLPEIVKTISYELFLKHYNDYFERDNQIFEAYQLMLEYAKELQKNWAVKFK